MSDHRLQNIQDTVRIPLYEEEPHSRFNSGDNIYGQRLVNLIPEFTIDAANQTKKLTLQKRPGIVDMGHYWLNGIVAAPTQCTVIDFISITALYDVCVAAVFDASVNSIYIIQVRPITGTSTTLGTIRGGLANVNDFCFLTEYSQSNAGSLYPAVILNYTKYDLTYSEGWYSRSSSGVFGASLTQITDTGFPPKQTPALITTGRFQFMNGTLYIATLDGRIWNSYATFNDAATWKNSTNQIGSISVNAYNDQLLGIERYKHHLVAFGKNTIQFFNDVGDNPCPLASTQQAFMKIGARSPRMVRNVNDVMYWVSYSDTGIAALYQMDGYTPIKISTTSLDTAIAYSVATLNAGLDVPTLNIQASMINGKTCIILNGVYSYTVGYYLSPLPTGANGTTDTYPLATLDFSQGVQVYNIEDKTWWTLQVWGDRAITLYCAGAFTSNSAGAYNQYILPQSGGADNNFLNTYIFKWRTDGIYKDSIPQLAAPDYPDLPIFTIAQTNHQWFFNEKRKRINKVKVIGYPQTVSGDTNVYSMYLIPVRNPREDQPAVSELPSRGISIPSSVSRMYWNNLGMARVWMFCLFEKSKLPLKLEALEVDIQQGSH